MKQIYNKDVYSEDSHFSSYLLFKNDYRNQFKFNIEREFSNGNKFKFAGDYYNLLNKKITDSPLSLVDKNITPLFYLL